MTTEELKRKIEAEGLDWAIQHYSDEPTDDPALAAFFNTLKGLWEIYDDSGAAFMELLGCE